MANHLQTSPILHSDSLPTVLRPFSGDLNTTPTKITFSFSFTIHDSLNFRARRRPQRLNDCAARRRVRYDDEEDEDEEYGHNEQIALLESYTQAAAGEALIVHAALDGDLVEVLVFKGFSSCLSFATSSDPSRSVLPARATIQSIDRIKGPFDPSNIEYIQRGITWESFNFPT
ncbi:uncharacterized protein LOC111447634 [Cucurbita moschata]|uniref:Uncharacterized protein LOC111447634 n=1 Tax=Cucurbita moschata TaxID=3662 RepID=A0A6J1FWQ3_CUCMO|nr:uncharacterized protein LOC111447634 [Cucurbita moschata]